MLKNLIPYDKFNETWGNNPIVILDTNTILYLYKCSSETSSHILTIYEEIIDKIWLPHQVTEEYEKNRQHVIAIAKKKYSDVTSNVLNIIEQASNKIKEQFQHYNALNFPEINELSSLITSKISEMREQVGTFESGIQDEIRKNEEMLKNDLVKEFVQKLKSHKKIGFPFSYSNKIALYAEGDSRYTRKLPPGYMDEKKDARDVTKTEKFGDLFIWKQILEHSRDNKRPIIFITNDKKEDWWVLKDNTPISHRPELSEEFHDYSNETFVMTNLFEFVRHVGKIIMKENKLSLLELSADSIASELIERKGWDLVLDQDYKLLNYLIHSGYLQDYVENALTDVEIANYGPGDISITNVELDNTSVTFEGTFEINIEAIVTERIFSDQELDSNAQISIQGYINFEFDIDLDKEENFIINETVKISVDGLEISHAKVDYYDHIGEHCFDCGSPTTKYLETNNGPICDNCSRNYELCSRCGQYKHRDDFLGAYCNECD